MYFILKSKVFTCQDKSVARGKNKRLSITQVPPFAPVFLAISFSNVFLFLKPILGF